MPLTIFWLQSSVGNDCFEEIRLHEEKKQKRYYEADEVKRKIYLDKIAGIKLENIVYIDETGLLFWTMLHFIEKRHYASLQEAMVHIGSI